MEEMILSEGKILPGGVLNVGAFLNKQIDTRFLKEIGEEIARLFADAEADRILTIESSGIAIAVAAGMAMDLPVVFAEKSRKSNSKGEYYVAAVHSFSHDKDNKILVEKEYMPAGCKVLVVDDFLAHGSAINGLIAIVEDAGSEVAGCVAAVEKGSKHGGDNLRARGYRVESLAIIDEITDEGITFRSGATVGELI